MKPLEFRKRLLILESELNRARLSEDWQIMAHGVRDLVPRVQNIGAWAAAAAALVGGLTSWRRNPPSCSASKTSWLQTLVKAAQLVSTTWLAFRSCADNKPHK